MKRTGAILLSIFLAMVLTVSNMAGAYHTAARVYAAEEETIGGGDNQDGESNEPQGQDAAGGLGDPTTSIAVDTTTVSAGEGENATNPQNPVPGQGDSQALSTGTVVSTPKPAPVTMFTVSFDANGHGTAPGAVSVADGECVEKPADLSADGFLFTGWYRDAGATIAWNFDTDTVNSDITLYAGWTEVVTATVQEDKASTQQSGSTEQAENTALPSGEGDTTTGCDNNTPAATTYTVTFDTNGYGITPSAVTANEGNTIQKPADPSENGYTFTGWYKDKDATDAWDFDADTVTGSLTLYAGWTQTMQRALRNTSALRNGNTYTVTIKCEGDGDAYMTRPHYGTEDTVSPGDTVWVKVGTEAGYFFKEWRVNTDNVNITANSNGYYEFQMPSEDVVITAVFAKCCSITVTNDGHGTASASETSGKPGTQVTLIPTPDTGYQFKEWQVDKGGVTVNDNNTFTLGDEDVEIRAVFERITGYFFVTLTDNGYGTADASAEGGTEGTEVELIARPQSGYSLDHWEVTPNTVSITNNRFQMPAQDVTVKAIFKYDPTNHFITIDRSLQNLKFGKPVTLRLSESGLSNGAISWKSSDPSTLSISGNTASFHKTGTVMITVSQEADGAFAAVSDSLEVTIGKGDASSIEWPAAGPAYQMMPIMDIPLSGGSTEFGTFSWNAQPGMYEHSQPGKTTGFTALFTPKAELEPYFETNISQRLTYTVQSRDTLESSITTSPGEIDLGSVEEGQLASVPKHQVMVTNLSNYGTVNTSVTVTPDDNEYFWLTHAAGSNPVSPGQVIGYNLEPKLNLAAGTYEDHIIFRITAEGHGTIIKSIPVKIVVTNAMPEATVTISPDPLSFQLMEGYVPDTVAQTITLTNTGQKPLEITGHTQLLGYKYDVELVEGSTTIPAGGTVTYRIKPKAGEVYPGLDMVFTTNLRFIFKDSENNVSAKGTRLKAQVVKYVDCFNAIVITPDTVDFGSESVGYQMPQEQTITFTNDQTVWIKADKYPESENYTIRLWQGDALQQQRDVTVSPSTAAKMTVRPKPGLAAGIYNDTVNVEFYNCNGEKVTKTVELKFAVENKYTVTVNGGTADISPADPGQTVTLTAAAIPGKEFEKWEINAGNITLADVNANITTFSMPKETVTVTAIFREIPYVITYNLDGGSNHPDNPVTYTVETETITLKDPSHGKYMFDGWYDASGNKVTQITKGSIGEITLKAKWKKKPAPTLTFPTAAGIVYGQTLADSVLTGGSTEYGTFAWEKPSTVPAAGTGLFYVIFTPYPETEQYYEPIPEADKRQLVDVTMHKQTPALTLTATKGDNAATLTATLTTAGQGDAPTRTVMFEYSEDNGLTWTTVPSGNAVALASGTGTATHVWNYPYSDREYQLRATYSGDFNYETANGNTTFDPRKEDQNSFEVRASSTQVTYGEALTFTIANEKGTGAVTYDVSDTSVMTVDANGNATILKYGIVTVTATKAGDNDYNAASAAISVTVKKAKLTFTAEDKTVKQGDPMPTLTFVTTGLVNGDTVSGNPSLTTSVANTDNTGDFTISISGGTVTTKGGASWPDCYDVVYQNGKLTINEYYIVSVSKGTANKAGGTAAASIVAFPGDTITVTADALPTGHKFGGWNVTSGTITLSDANNTTATFTMPKENVSLEATYVIDASQITKTMVECTELTGVPQSLKYKYTSLDHMKADMLNKLVKLGLNGTNVGSNYLFYDVVLKVSFDNGASWVIANEQNFPREGLFVFLTDQRTGGYPNGTARNTHRFYVSHMFTTNVNGKNPGDTEEMIATNQQGGISVTLTGLSPVLVTWEKVTTPTQPTQPTTPGSGGGSGGGTPTAQPTSTGGQNAVENANTTVVSTNASGARSASDAQNTSARGGQTGDDIYERLGLHTMILLAALLLLIAQLRKLMEENALFAVAVSRAGTIRKTKDACAHKQKRRTKRTVSGLEFIELDVGTKRRPLAKRCDKNNRNVRKH